jgi:hypothetical protein
MHALTRGEQKSLAYHRAVADRLRVNPALVDVALRRLDWYKEKNPLSARYYAEWQRLLLGPLDSLMAALVSESDAACALRQENPFVDLIPQTERARIYQGVAHAIDHAQLK